MKNILKAIKSVLREFDNKLNRIEKSIPDAVKTMTGASATEDGKSGIVPAPKAGQQNFPLFGDGGYKALTQADYTQNDETASDYIKNRPFGYYTIQDVILEEIPFTYKNTKSQTSLSLNESELVKSKSSIDVLTVVDEAFGERYDLPKRIIPEYTLDESSCIGFGNVSLISSSSTDTGEKFLIDITNNGGYTCVYRVVDESRLGIESSLTCLVSKPVGKKVDPDFLPIASLSKLGCGKATVIDDSDTATKRNTKPVYIDSDGILYSGLTLPTAGSVGDIPVIKSIAYGNQYEYGRTTLGGFLDGVSSTNYKHVVLLNKERTETVKTLKNVQLLLNDVNSHYSADNIAKRDDWMKWVNDRTEVYDESIEKLRQTLSDITQVLKDNTKMTEEMFVQSSRDRIIDFATKVENKNTMASREEFNRIFKVYDKYEKFLKERELPNGEVDINYQIIKESYEEHLRNHTFIEDVRGYTK